MAWAGCNTGEFGLNSFVIPLVIVMPLATVVGPDMAVAIVGIGAVILGVYCIYWLEMYERAEREKYKD